MLTFIPQSSFHYWQCWQSFCVLNHHCCRMYSHQIYIIFSLHLFKLNIINGNVRPREQVPLCFWKVAPSSCDPVMTTTTQSMFQISCPVAGHYQSHIGNLTIADPLLKCKCLIRATSGGFHFHSNCTLNIQLFLRASIAVYVSLCSCGCMESQPVSECSHWQDYPVLYEI